MATNFHDLQSDIAFRTECGQNIPLSLNCFSKTLGQFSTQNTGISSFGCTLKPMTIHVSIFCAGVRGYCFMKPFAISTLKGKTLLRTDDEDGSQSSFSYSVQMRSHHRSLNAFTELTETSFQSLSHRRCNIP